MGSIARLSGLFFARMDAKIISYFSAKTSCTIFATCVYSFPTKRSYQHRKMNMKIEMYKGAFLVKAVPTEAQLFALAKGRRKMKNRIARMVMGLVFGAAFVFAHNAHAKNLDVYLDCAKNDNVVAHMNIGAIERSTLTLDGHKFVFVKAGIDESGQNTAMFKNDELQEVAGYAYSQQSFIKGSAMITTYDGKQPAPVTQICTITKGILDGKRAF